MPVAKTYVPPTERERPHARTNRWQEVWEDTCLQETMVQNKNERRGVMHIMLHTASGEQHENTVQWYKHAGYT